MWKRGWSSHAMFLIERGAVAATTAMCVSHEIWRCEKYSIMKSLQPHLITPPMATNACLAVPLRLAIKPSKSLSYINSSIVMTYCCTSYYRHCKMQSPEIPTSPCKWSVTTASVNDGLLQDIMPRKPPSHHIRCSTTPAHIISDAKDYHACCLKIRKHRRSVAALPRASSPLVALLPRSTSGI
jgi:hypothetical protein